MQFEFLQSTFSLEALCRLEKKSRDLGERLTHGPRVQTPCGRPGSGASVQHCRADSAGRPERAGGTGTGLRLPPTPTPPPLAFCGGRAAELRTKPFACSKGSVSVLLRISVPFSRTKNTEMLEKFPVATGFQVSHNSVV